jgi:hypothetical protein
MPWPIFSWNSTSGTLPTIIGWGSSNSTNLNPGVGLQRPVPLVNDTRTLVKLAQQGEKGKLPTGVQSDYDAAMRQLTYDSKDSKPMFPWLIASAALVILYFILKRK